jgi:type I restriction enzyme S subunit
MAPKFLYYAVQSEQFQRQVALGWSFGTQQNLGMRTLEQLKLIIPTLSEQKEIANYLDMKIGDIEKAIKVKNEKIDRLVDYKKSLIYEYVTGKKEVC